MVALLSKILVLGAEDGLGGCRDDTICAFCFRTSAGVRMVHETSSPVAEARAWASGRGRGVVTRRDFVAS